jgi:hypothetical protein
MKLLPFAVIFFMVYALGYPAFAAYTILRNKERIMQDQILRAKNSGNTRATNPHNYDFRKRYGKLYYQFKPWHYYWILMILFRKFSIAVCGLMFRRTPVFLLSFTLLILFTSYSAHVRHQPYMSLSERALVLQKYDSAQQGIDKMKVNMKAKKLNRMASKKTATAKFADMGNKAAESKQRRNQAAAYFWNYNAVETTLLTCAILVVLMGLMFQSDQIEPNSSQELALLSMAVLVIVGSMIYFGLVLLTEIMLGLGVGEKYIAACLNYKKKHQPENKPKAVEEEEVVMITNQSNPMMSNRRSMAVDDSAASKESAATITALQEEIKVLKKKVQAGNLVSYNSGKTTKRMATKKKFANNTSQKVAGAEETEEGSEQQKEEMI